MNGLMVEGDTVWVKWRDQGGGTRKALGGTCPHKIYKCS